MMCLQNCVCSQENVCVSNQRVARFTLFLAEAQKWCNKVCFFPS